MKKSLQPQLKKNHFNGMFLQLLSESDCLQIDDHFIRHFDMPDTSEIEDDSLIIDINGYDSEGDEFVIDITMAEVLNAKFCEASSVWKCGGFDVSLFIISPIGSDPVKQNDKVKTLDQYQKSNAASRVQGYYMPRPHEVTLKKTELAFQRAKKEAIDSLQKQIDEIHALNSDQFFEQRRQGLN